MRIIAIIGGLLLAFALPTASNADSFAAALGNSSDGSPDQIFEWCRSPTLEDAKLCALKACKRAKNYKCDLIPSCDPAQWSGVIAMSKADLVKYSYVCDEVSRDNALKALKLTCQNFRHSHPTSFKSCVVESLISPDAETSETDVVTWKDASDFVRQAE